MPYLTECQVCNHQVEVADPAQVPTLQCPACASLFSMLPAKPAPRRVVLVGARTATPVLEPPPAPAPPSAADTATSHKALTATTLPTPPPAVSVRVLEPPPVAKPREALAAAPKAAPTPLPDFDPPSSSGLPAWLSVSPLLLAAA